MLRYMTAKEAADALGVAVPTIYAYVSRGLIRSEETSESNRSRRYHAEDIERLLAQREASRDPEKATGEALHWGMPVLESALTLITDDGPYYRGRSVAALAATHTLEQVAALLWTGDEATDVFAGGAHPALQKCLDMQAQISTPYMTPLGAMQSILPVAAAEDFTAYDLEQESVIRSGARILRLLVALVTGVASAAPIAEALADHWEKPSAAALINAALVLCADHELNASSFTARVVAGAGANPYQVVIGGLAAFHGVKHGGATERAESFLRGIDSPDSVRETVAEHLRRGERLPGFGHPIYPGGGDPRADALFVSMTAHLGESPPTIAIVQATSALAQKPPNIDVALAALVCALDLPRGSASVIFVLGRVVGWLAHALEQYEGRMIRPRARYVGPPPVS